ncbi:hypothetical protein P153DRAFT_390626 [Dothidotthia symphoricarpi CBS 119687]|uniref:Uncharacterized protein n=1 Tax=Dothidotthia symphoricarpi CBS 119687 TaxID=1392245 RepID=A0A6A6A0U5_9PLEO|nr:uncharacterized protein P153DRAFT_390626 [Dothidotthia symphoricarpi CBS 119687]KAF2124587.1 hypothetical protein P153DRAFT_390626 [Dothidotthia symphoricarpi CBS 119687]
MAHPYTSHARSRNIHKRSHQEKNKSSPTFLDGYDEQHRQSWTPEVQQCRDYDHASIVTKPEEMSKGKVYLAMALTFVVPLIILLHTPFLFSFLVAVPFLFRTSPRHVVAKV